jgi:hypothetical protein
MVVHASSRRLDVVVAHHCTASHRAVTFISMAHERDKRDEEENGGIMKRKKTESR